MTQALNAEGWRVRALVRRAGHGAAFAEQTLGSLDDQPSLDRLLDGVDAVVHCAGLLRARSSAEFHAVNQAGVARLAAAAANCGTPPRFILMSSLAAREPGLSSYAHSKRGGERVLVDQDGGLSWTILRPPAVYGPGDRETLDFFRLYKRGLAPLPGGDGARMSLIHVEDLAGAVTALLASGRGAGQVMEVRDGQGTGYRWSDIAAVAGRCFNRPMIRFTLPRALMDSFATISHGVSRLSGTPPRLSRDKVRELYHRDWVVRENPIVELTGWTPQKTLDDGFAQTIAWYRAQGWL